jgi:hypothetical protein
MATRVLDGSLSTEVEGEGRFPDCSLVGARMQGCILAYRCVQGGHPATEGAFGDYFAGVATWICGGTRNSAMCTWIAHGVGEPVGMDARGVYYSGYDVVVYLPLWVEVERSLCAAASGDSKWGCSLVRRVEHGPQLEVWVAKQGAVRAVFPCFGTGFGWLCGATMEGGDPGQGSSVYASSQSDCGECPSLVCGQKHAGEAEAGTMGGCHGFGAEWRVAERESFSSQEGVTEEGNPAAPTDGLGSSWCLVDGVGLRRSCRSLR